jgi:hypothetical protein
MSCCFSFFFYYGRSCTLEPQTWWQRRDQLGPEDLRQPNLIGAMQLSSYVGADSGAFLFCVCTPLLRPLCGNDAISPAIFSAVSTCAFVRRNACCCDSRQRGRPVWNARLKALYVPAAASINFLETCRLSETDATSRWCRGCCVGRCLSISMPR